MNLTAAYITALTGDSNTVLDWRFIHDRDRSYQAFNMRGSYTELSEHLHAYNQQGYGVFCNINAMNGQGATLNHVQHIRTHVIDLDDLVTATMNYDRACKADMKPHFAVQSSPGKYHIYWLVEPYTDNDFYTLHQRKLAQMYDGDPSINDATRVLRVPGFYHCKGEPHLIQCWSINGGPRYTSEQIQQALQHINIVERTTTRHPLGTPDMQAPSLEWLQYALSLVNPNDLDYAEWMSFSAAVKQAGWSLTDENTLFLMWSVWCQQYENNDERENQTIWKSFKDTQLGWGSIQRRIDHLAGLKHFGGVKHTQNPHTGSLNPYEGYIIDTNINEAERQALPEYLDGHGMSIWFKGCVLIEREAKIFTPTGRFMTSTQFNSAYGGRFFSIDRNGKPVNTAFEAATRSTAFTIDKVDHVRFLPQLPTMGVINDEMERPGLNIYKPCNIDAREGDVSIWTNHLSKIIPDPNDRKMFEDYFAHCIKYPGYKIQYAPLLQSAEGIGKSAFVEIMSHALGSMYVYRPKAGELVSSGNKFNAWMRAKLMIMVDEIKVDERRELIEILKPMITDNRIEIQSKGVDQEMEDNMANWLFFSNYKDAIPINKNGRRYAIFFSSMQSERDILQAGMDKPYFDRFWTWLRKEGGLQAVTHYYMHYNITEGDIPVRAPRTSSYNEALRISRSPVEVIIQDAIEDGITGFRSGFVSIEAALNKVRNTGVRNANARTIQTVLETMNYYEIGKTETPIMQENPSAKSLIYSTDPNADVTNYQSSQGYGM